MKKIMIVFMLTFLIITGCSSEKVVKVDNDFEVETEDEVLPEELIDDFFAENNTIRYSVVMASVGQRIQEEYYVEEIPETVLFRSEMVYEAEVEASDEIICIDGFLEGMYYINDDEEIIIDAAPETRYISKTEDGLLIYSYDGVYEEWYIDDYLYERYKDCGHLQMDGSLDLSSDMFEGLYIAEAINGYVVKGVLIDSRGYLDLRYGEYVRNFCANTDENKVNATLTFDKNGNLLEYELQTNVVTGDKIVFNETEVEQYSETVILYKFSNDNGGTVEIPQSVIDDVLDGSKYE